MELNPIAFAVTAPGGDRTCMPRAEEGGTREDSWRTGSRRCTKVRAWPGG